MRLDIRRIGAIKTAEVVVGNRTRVKVVKNKLAPPFREVEFDITYGEGVSREGMLIDMGVEENVIDKSGAWLSFRGERIGQGRENAKVFLKENPEVAERIEAEVLQKKGLSRDDKAVEAAAAAASGETPPEPEAPTPVEKPIKEMKSSKGGRLRARA